jgi:ribose 5-phosphate isomerase A
MTLAPQQSDWIPAAFQASARNIAREVVKQFVKRDQVIGLGSGPMAAEIVRAMGSFSEKDSLECIPSSFQIKLEAECSGLKLADENRIPEVDIVFDGADEIDSRFNMIKGGGGALLREKILHYCGKQIIIAAEANKFVSTFTWPVPVEVHPFATHSARYKLQSIGGNPRMRMLKEGYPYVSENGNFILDTSFDFPADLRQLEVEIKCIPGIVEAGLFTRCSGLYFKANEDGTFETSSCP